MWNKLEMLISRNPTRYVVFGVYYNTGNNYIQEKWIYIGKHWISFNMKMVTSQCK